MNTCDDIPKSALQGSKKFLVTIVSAQNGRRWGSQPVIQHSGVDGAEIYGELQVAGVVEIAEVGLERFAHGIFAKEEKVVALEHLPVFALAFVAELVVGGNAGAAAEAEHGLVHFCRIDHDVGMLEIGLEQGAFYHVVRGARDGEHELVARDVKEQGRFEAHAWVELEGTVLNNALEQHRHFAPFDRSVMSMETETS